MMKFVNAFRSSVIYSNFDYYRSRLMKRPYFGRKYGAFRLINKSDAEVLKNLLELLPESKTLKCLEIGSWAGTSAIILGNVLKRRGKGILYCLDTWQGSSNAIISKQAIKYRKILKIFLDNIKYAGVEKYIKPVITTSDDFAKNNKGKEFFDFVFIDGDHSYSQVKNDIENFLSMLNVGGIMCGHDIELLSNEVDEKYSRENSEKDMLISPKGVAYHPGVTLALKDVLKNEVGLNHTIWAIRKTDQGFVPCKVSV